MSQHNIEIVHRAFEAFDRGDMDTVLALCDEDILITQAPEFPEAQDQHGHKGVLAAFAIWPEQWDDYWVEITDIPADPGDYVVVTTRQGGRGKESGIDVEANFTFVFRVRDDKFTEWRIFVHESQALEAVGAAP